jgi:hypothetical protein
MIEQMQAPWPWYIAGAMIGLIVPALLILGNKSFGISSSMRHVCAACFPEILNSLNTIGKKKHGTSFLLLELLLVHLLLCII